MSFRVVSERNAQSSGNEVLLVKDNWNDWYVWVTQFFAVVVYADGTRVDIGHVKIASLGMTEENGRTVLPDVFSSWMKHILASDRMRITTRRLKSSALIIESGF